MQWQESFIIFFLYKAQNLMGTLIFDAVNPFPAKGFPADE